jgi:solute:Na+ symporter, SSS family
VERAQGAGHGGVCGGGPLVHVARYFRHVVGFVHRRRFFDGERGAGIPVRYREYCRVVGVQAAGGWAEIRATVEPTHFTVPGAGMTALAFVSLFLTLVLGETLVPPYVQRLYIGRNAAHTARGTLLSGLFSVPFFALTGLIGLVALVLNPELDPNLALPYVVKEVLPIGVKGLVIAGVISIVMSSADSFLNAAAIAFTHDIAKPLLGSRIRAENELWIAKGVTLVVGIVAIAFALTIQSVFEILLFAYNFWAPIILVPLVGTFLGVRAKLPAFLAGGVAGLVVMLFWDMHLKARTGVSGLVIGVFANMAVFSLVSTFQRHEGSVSEG